MDAFTTPLEGPLFPTLLAVCRARGIDPTATTELERHFVALVLEFRGLATPQDFSVWLDAHLVQEFQSIAQPPRWVQGAAWPLSAERPMVFVGQLEATNPAFPGLARACLYVFWTPTSGECFVVVQGS
jgi:hypothetical protein